MLYRYYCYSYETYDVFIRLPYIVAVRRLGAKD